jgi:hypothetical protein
MAAAIFAAKAGARKRGGSLSVVASICGTEGDPQELVKQVKVLKETGAIIFRSSAQAAQFSAELIKSLLEAPDAR